MAVTKQIQIGAQTNDIGADAQNVDYTNAALEGVTSVKGALDELVSGGGGGGGSEAVTPYFKNPPLPAWKSGLKVLIIGNSYTLYCIGDGNDSTMPTILNELAVTTDEFKLSYMHAQSSTLAAWLNAFKNQSIYGAHEYCEFENGAWKVHTNNIGTASIYNVVKNTAWDVVVFQTYPQTNTGSNEQAQNYETFKATVKEFIYEIRKVCPNHNVAFGYHMIWAKNSSRAAYTTVWNNIVKATENLVADADVDIIVPTGTALMDAVSTETFKGESHDFLVRDPAGHPGWGAARYIAACVIWETLFAPVLGRSMYGLTQLPPYTRATTNPADIEVTALNIELCQKIAMAAVCDRFNANTTIDPIVTP